MSHADPELWKRIKDKVMKDDLGGRPGQWSAIKAMIASKKYKEQGGTYKGKPDDTKGLRKWMKEDWTTLSGKPSLETGERFLPRKAIEALTPAQYAATTAKKRKDTKKGKQFSSQPDPIAELVSKFR
jgi:hypothetical protein